MNDQRASQFGGKNKLCEGIGYSFETDSWDNIGWGTLANRARIVEACQNLQLKSMGLAWRGTQAGETKKALEAQIAKQEARLVKLKKMLKSR